MQRIEVGVDVITLTTVTEPWLSVFGNVVSPGSTSVVEQTWDEISRISLMKVHWDPERPPQACLVIDLSYGEFFEIADDAEGFAEAVRELSGQCGVPEPDWANLPEDGVDILPFGSGR
ncbi:hypothetical protein Q0Z83_021400 [Actinoplanes sichuanensis]|uniref:Uncharacterized protein n=1 Tax=Actinoplanes sichuanensis TaxID=512349 RepID=A0ABW4AJ10_9ACTN|nr:hypothetical protein [Actinoplanes sichuanensis]BEL03949.1 hypothetical protein Q0Z83_021400 [Actinoplanes sichuanensis]